jgi:nitrogen regulatory protein P-II 1
MTGEFKMEQTNHPKLIIILVNAGHSEEVIALAREAGATGATILNARGEGAKHEVFMGITVDSEKEMILCLADSDVADRVLAAVKEKAGIKTSAHGVCFTMPVEKTIGISSTTMEAK